MEELAELLSDLPENDLPIFPFLFPKRRRFHFDVPLSLSLAPFQLLLSFTFPSRTTGQARVSSFPWNAISFSCVFRFFVHGGFESQGSCGLCSPLRPLLLGALQSSPQVRIILPEFLGILLDSSLNDYLEIYFYDKNCGIQI